MELGASGFRDHNDYVHDCQTLVREAYPELSDYEIEKNYIFYLREGGIIPPHEDDYCFECGS